MTTLYQFNRRIVLTEVDFPDFLVRGAAIFGTEAVVIWDTLTHPDDLQPLLPLLNDRRRIVVYSHADWDHVWGTAAVAGAGLSVVGHRLCRRRFDADVPTTLEQRRIEEPGRWDAVRLLPPDEVFDEQMVLDLGGLSLELRALPGHTPDSIVGLIPEHRLLLMGDTVETPLPCIPPDCRLNRWQGELERWLADPRVKTVVPAHGPWGGKEIIRRTLDYLEDLEAGRPPMNLGDLTPFYHQTHADNLQHCHPAISANTDNQ
jgi:glyoxylase-like metal-dependent hydrolase (beta-lactamase superfamily II)